MSAQGSLGLAGMTPPLSSWSISVAGTGAQSVGRGTLALSGSRKGLPDKTCVSPGAVLSRMLCAGQFLSPTLRLGSEQQNRTGASEGPSADRGLQCPGWTRPRLFSSRGCLLGPLRSGPAPHCGAGFLSASWEVLMPSATPGRPAASEGTGWGHLRAWGQ